MTEHAPNGSNYHDHLCNCPGCDPQPPDPSEEEIAGYEMMKAIDAEEAKYRREQVLALRDAGKITIQHHRRQMPVDGEEYWLYYETHVFIASESAAICAMGDTIDDNIDAVFESLLERGLVESDHKYE